MARMGQEAGDEWHEVADLLFLAPTGSPFTVKVTGEGRMKESITRRRQAPSIATIGSTCDLNLKIPGGRREEPGGAGLRGGPRARPWGLCPSGLLLTSLPSAGSTYPTGNWFQMVSAQERLTRTFTRSSHTYTRTERTEISKTRGGETKREVRVEESTQVGGDPFPAVFGDFLGRERLGSFGSITRQQEGEQDWAGVFTGRWAFCPSGLAREAAGLSRGGGVY